MIKLHVLLTGFDNVAYSYVSFNYFAGVFFATKTETTKF